MRSRGKPRAVLQQCRWRPCHELHHTVKTLGLTVPPALLGRGDDVIERGAQCLLLAQSGHLNALSRCPLSGVKRTLIGHAVMSAIDPKRT
jgi:hypothetical protein